jgi:predicted lipoprotein with Yx(FWY)xxD motif
MKRPALLIPLVAAIAVIAVVAVAIAGNSDNKSTGGSRNTPAANSYGGYGSAPAPSPTSPDAASGVARIATADHGLGPMLVDGEGRTLYLWKADTGTKSTCLGACARDWPPVATSDAPRAGTGAQQALLGTTQRSDGTMQVTYAGHPLYRFAFDSKPGQATGQGSQAYGAAWWVVAPGGAAVTG